MDSYYVDLLHYDIIGYEGLSQSAFYVNLYQAVIGPSG